jgi:peptide-methionine (S)-S-oxide reductase
MSSSAPAAAANIPPGAQCATVAAGCFWGVEHAYRKAFGLQDASTGGGGGGLMDARVGYIGGEKEMPTYREVCDGTTGHAEALQIIFDPQQVTYRQLIEFFYRMHDPTTLNAQGPDRGPQYRSAIFYHDEDQERIAREVTAAANKRWWEGRIVTEILSAADRPWWNAEEYHQLYLDKNPAGYACPSHRIRNEFPPLD